MRIGQKLCFFTNGQFLSVSVFYSDFNISFGQWATLWQIQSSNMIFFSFSYSFPFNKICELFSTCQDIIPCSNCVSETRSCYGTCSTDKVGTISNNLLDILTNVESELICKEQCGASQDCKYYTYFKEGDANAKLCVLLSFLIEPFQPCENCVTGYGNCQDVQDCGLMYNGETNKSLKFTDPGVMINVTTTKPFLGECQL